MCRRAPARRVRSSWYPTSPRGPNPSTASRTASTSSGGRASSTSTREDSDSSRTAVTTIAAATASATTGSIHCAPVMLTSASPINTAAEVIASVRRCAASPSSAAESVARALRAMTAETIRLTTNEKPTTAMPRPTVWT